MLYFISPNNHKCRLHVRWTFVIEKNNHDIADIFTVGTLVKPWSKLRIVDGGEWGPGMGRKRQEITGHSVKKQRVSGLLEKVENE